MFYQRDGRVIRGTPKHKPIVASVRMRPNKPITLMIPPILIKYPKYDVVVGRGDHLGMIGIYYSEEGRYKARMASRKCKLPIPSHTSMRDKDADVKYEVTEDLFYFTLPDGAFEYEKWWLRLPNVSDNPQEVRRSFRDLHSMWGDGGEDEEPPLLRH